LLALDRWAGGDLGRVGVRFVQLIQEEETRVAEVRQFQTERKSASAATSGGLSRAPLSASSKSAASAADPSAPQGST
jgi:hypothetical protein